MGTKIHCCNLPFSMGQEKNVGDIFAFCALTQEAYNNKAAHLFFKIKTNNLLIGGLG